VVLRWDSITGVSQRDSGRWGAVFRDDAFRVQAKGGIFLIAESTVRLVNSEYSGVGCCDGKDRLQATAETSPIGAWIGGLVAVSGENLSSDRNSRRVYLSLVPLPFVLGPSIVNVLAGSSPLLVFL
jgi:hypothetical protein